MATDPANVADQVASSATAGSARWMFLVDASLGLAVAALATGVVLIGRRRPPRVVQESEQGSQAPVHPAPLDLAPLRRSDQLGASLDLDQVLSNALEMLVSVTGFSAAAILLGPDAQFGEDPAPVVATVGMDAVELAALPLEWAPERPVPNRVMVSYIYGNDSENDAISGGVVIPLLGQDAPTGTVAALWRGGSGPAEAELAAVEEIAEGAAIPIRNARLYRAALANAEIDALTRLYNRRYFHEMLAREIARTQRYGRRLTVAILDVDNFKALNERLGHLAGDSILADIGASIRAVARLSDVACRVGGDEFGVILTEAAASEAEHFFQRLRFALRAEAGGQRLTVSAGVAELRPEDDSAKVFERADAALFRAKRIGQDQFAIADDGPDHSRVHLGPPAGDGQA